MTWNMSESNACAQFMVLGAVQKVSDMGDQSNNPKLKRLQIERLG